MIRRVQPIRVLLLSLLVIYFTIVSTWWIMFFEKKQNQREVVWVSCSRKSLKATGRLFTDYTKACAIFSWNARDLKQLVKEKKLTQPL